MTDFKIGDVVRLSEEGKAQFDDWASAGVESGTVEALATYVEVRWNTELPNVGDRLGFMLPEEIEPVVDYQTEIKALTEKYQRVIQMKDSALVIAAAAFGQYATHHYLKLTPESAIKGVTNEGLAQLMNDALEAD